MKRAFAITILLCITASAARAQEAVPIGKGIDLGPLTDLFVMVSGDVTYDASTGYRVTLKLRAKQDVDTANLYCQAGFFDKNKLLLLAPPLVFQAGFPLMKGESINAYIVYASPQQDEGFPWHMIYVRPGKKPN
jgi:hypothetical protein